MQSTRANIFGMMITLFGMPSLVSAQNYDLTEVLDDMLVSSALDQYIDVWDVCLTDVHKTLDDLATEEELNGAIEPGMRSFILDETSQKEEQCAVNFQTAFDAAVDQSYDAMAMLDGRKSKIASLAKRRASFTLRHRKAKLVAAFK